MRRLRRLETVGDDQSREYFRSLLIGTRLPPLCRTDGNVLRKYFMYLGKNSYVLKAIDSLLLSKLSSGPACGSDQKLEQCSIRRFGHHTMRPRLWAMARFPFLVHDDSDRHSRQPTK